METDQAMSEPVVCGTKLACMCGRADFSVVHLYDRRPEDETQFDMGGQAQYRRELRRCATCGHTMCQKNMTKICL